MRAQIGHTRAHGLTEEGVTNTGEADYAVAAKEPLVQSRADHHIVLYVRAATFAITKASKKHCTGLCVGAR